jgi:hypothetical protein
MASPPTSSIDPAKITGIYPFLGAFLVVVEGLLGYWFYLAGSAIERGIAGGAMVLLMVAALAGAVFVYLVGVAAERNLFGMFKAPTGEATQAEISAAAGPAGAAGKAQAAAPPTDFYVGPDRSYVVNRPPAEWTIRELTQGEWVSRGLGVEADAEAGDQPREVVVFAPDKVVSIIPKPGQTSVEGSRLLTALESVVPTELAIIPFDRAQPPLYYERTLETNVWAAVGQVLATGVFGTEYFKPGILDEDGRRYLLVGLKQDVKDAFVNGKDGQDVTVHIVFIGIQGDLRDFLLVVKYAEIPGRDNEWKANLEILDSLIESFRPATVDDAQKQAVEARAAQQLADSLAQNGKTQFASEFELLLTRLKHANLDNPDERLHAMKAVQPFEALAKAMKLQAPDLDALWAALHKAEAGDANDFKQKLAEMINLVQPQEKK